MAVPARLVSIGLAGCAALVVSGCGSSGSPSGAISGPPKEPAPTALVSSMQSSVRQADSVHVDGKLTNNGVPISVNLGMHRNGDISGTVSQNGAPFQIIGLSSKIYIKATQSFLHEVGAPASACAVVCGRWLLLTPPEAKQITGDLSMNSLTGPLTAGRVPTLTKAGTKSVNGQPAWVLRAADGSTLAVSAGSRHYPLAASTGGSTQEVVTYSQWNSVPQPAAPPASQVLNLNNLK